MPDLNKQTLINLLIDSPLREPIKINLIDIINNTNDADLPKTFSTIVKELEIFQKATERRMKLADETIAKLGSESPQSPDGNPSSATPPVPPVSTPPTASSAPMTAEPKMDTMPSQLPQAEGLSAPKIDLPPLPKAPSSEQPGNMPSSNSSTPTPNSDAATKPTEPTLPPLPAPNDSSGADEDALKEIQKELDALKSSASVDAVGNPAPAQPASPVQE